MTGQLERTRIFLAVAERESFAAAARALHMSRSAVTRHVSDLEAELGAQLLVRTTRSVSLTIAGRIYRDRARHLARNFERVGDEVREQQNTMRGRLKVSAPLSFGLRFLPDVIAQFRILYPDLAMDMDLTDRMVDILTEDVDMALRISGPPDDVSTIWRKLCVVPRSIVAAPAYLDRQGRPDGPGALVRHRCLAYTHSETPDMWRLSRGGESVEVALRARFAANNGDLLADLAVAGEGIALLPRFIVEHHLRDGGLETILDEWAPPPIWLTAFYPPYVSLPAKVATFTEFVKDRLKAAGPFDVAP